MEEIIGIQLYLGALVSPSQPAECEIENLETIHQIEIQNIQNDPPLKDWIMNEYDEEIDDVVPVDITDCG